MSARKENREKLSLEAAVRYFSKCKAKVALKNNLELQMALETVKNAAVRTGLDPQNISVLLDAAASGYFAQSVSYQLIHSLIPKTTVPQEAVIKAISWMSTNKPPVAIQNHLVRWMLVVYDYIDGYDKIHCLYGILFFFIDSQIMLPHVCHLLFLLTRKEDVKLFRVRKLLSLIQGRVGPQSCLIGLLTIYKLYYPNLVSFALPASNKMFFGSYDRKWRNQVREIVKAQGTVLSLDHLELQISKSRQLADRPRPKKRRRLDIPLSHSSSANINQREIDKVPLSVDVNKVPFVRIDTFVNLLQNVDKIEFPSQIASCLKDPVLQHLMAYAGDRVVAARFTYWLQHVLTEEFLNNTPTSMEDNEQLLKMLGDFTDFLQESVPVVDNFLAAFLHTWNGVDYGPLIFRLITRCQMYPFKDLNCLILEPLRQLYFSSSVYFKCQCLLTLTELLRNYATYESRRLKAWTAVIAADEPLGTTLKTESTLFILFPERLNEDVQVSTVLQQLAAFMDKLAVLGLQLEGDNPLLLHVIVGFVNLLSSLTAISDMDHIVLPSQCLIRLVLFSSSAAAISKLGEAFCRYKEAFTHIASRRRENVSAFNDMLVDICDTLWRHKTFNNLLQGTLRTLSSDLSSVFHHLEISYPSSRFSIFQSQAFLPQAWDFLLKTQPEGKKVHPSQLKSVKDTYLDFLQQQRLFGIVRFINTFIMRKSATGRSLEKSQSAE